MIRGTRGTRGAALVVTLVVTLMLSMLGMAVVSYSASEEKTAASWRDRAQVSQVARAGVRMAQRMFDAPDDAMLVPIHGTHFVSETDLNRIGVFRTLRGAIGSHYSGTDERLFRGPFRDSWERLFAGARDPSSGIDAYDLRFSCTDPEGEPVAPGDCWLATKLNSLIGNPPGGLTPRITEISFYAPPTIDGRRFGYATVRVTAARFDAANRLVAAETIEAVLGSATVQPSILADGDIEIEEGRFCGECQRVHANGDVDALSGSFFSGSRPPISATGSVRSGSSSLAAEPVSGAARIEPPPINPWDLLYRPTSAESLSKYYLLTMRAPTAEWTDGDPATVIAPRDCGLSQCQDYGLEYTAGFVAQAPRSSAGQGRLYRWNEATQNWDLVSETDGEEVPRATGLAIGSAVFEVWPHADVIAPAPTDAAALPFNSGRVAVASFRMNAAFDPAADDESQGITVLVDGGVMIGTPVGASDPELREPWRVSIIAAGSIHLAADAHIDPALPNRVMLIAGRDVVIEGELNADLSASCCIDAPGFLTPPDDEVLIASSAVIAAHEQISIAGRSTILGLMITENEINLDDARDTAGFRSASSAVMGSRAIHLAPGFRHARACGSPVWPWPEPVRTSVLSMRRD